VRAAVFTRPAVLRRLFGLAAAEVQAAVRSLAARGALLETAVAGWPGRWIVDAGAVSSKRGVVS
jgi:hypothetical protein